MPTLAMPQTKTFSFSGEHATQHYDRSRQDWVACSPDCETGSDIEIAQVGMSFQSIYSGELDEKSIFSSSSAEILTRCVCCCIISHDFSRVVDRLGDLLDHDAVMISTLTARQAQSL